MANPVGDKLNIYLFHNWTVHYFSLQKQMAIVKQNGIKTINNFFFFFFFDFTLHNDVSDVKSANGLVRLNNCTFDQ